MKAMLSKQVGGPETLVLEELPDPKPAAGEVVIAVKACGVNYPDLLIIEDRYQYKPERPFSPGGEVAGIVEAVGSGVTSLKVGDRVIGSATWGGMAEKLALKAERCTPFPAAMPIGRSRRPDPDLRHVDLRAEGSRQAGQGRDAAGARRRRRRRPVRRRARQGDGRARDRGGVDARRRSRSPRSTAPTTASSIPPGPFDKAGSKALADLFKKACGETGADVIYDPVGGDYSEAALRAIGWEGRFLVVGFPAGIPRLPLNLTLLKSCQVVGVFWGEFTRRDPAGNAANIRALMQFYADGAIRPLVSERYPLAQAGAAIAKLGAAAGDGQDRRHDGVRHDGRSHTLVVGPPRAGAGRRLHLWPARSRLRLRRRRGVRRAGPRACPPTRCG